MAGPGQVPSPQPTALVRLSEGRTGVPYAGPTVTSQSLSHAEGSRGHRRERDSLSFTIPSASHYWVPHSVSGPGLALGRRPCPQGIQSRREDSYLNK